MPTADLLAKLDQRLVLIAIDAFEHFFSKQSMPLHDLKLFIRQFARFIDDFRRNRDLADVVQ